MSDSPFEQELSSSETTFPTATIYTPTNVLLGSFLGGPLVAGYFISRNFSAFGESEKAWLTWIITIIAAAVIFCIAFSLSETNSRAIPAAYTVMAYTLARHYQGDSIDAHVNAGGAKHGWLNVIGISIAGLILTLVLVAVIAVLVGVDV